MFLTRMTSLSFLLLALSPFVIFDSDCALISCPLCKSNTLWNILTILDNNEFLLLVFEFDYLSLLCYTNTLRNSLMMLGTNVEQGEIKCCVQEWQLWRDRGRGSGGICCCCFFFCFVFFLFCFFL